MRRALLPGLLLLLLSGAGWWGAETVRTSAWVTGDEPDHVRACRELRSGPGVVSNFEHPVLAKLLGAAGLPASPPARFVDETRAARRLFPLLLALLAAAAGGWALRRSGAAAGLAVAALLVVEPTLRGHAPLVHSDLLLTAFLVAAAAALDLSGAPREPRPGMLLLSGGLYGLALASKYSALPFLAVFLVAATFRLKGFGGRGPAPRAARRRGAGRGTSGAEADAGRPVAWSVAAARAALLVGLPALLVAGLVQQATVAATTSPGELAAGIERKFRSYPYEAEAIRGARTLPRGAAAYLAGLYWVKASAAPGVRYNYFLGEASGKGFLLYFPVALALKLTTASVLALSGALALAFAAAALAATRRRGGARERRMRRLLRLLAARSALPAFLGAAYLGAAMISNVNIGVRHAMPAIPFGLVAAAGILRTVFARRPLLRRGVLAVALLAASVEASAYLGREIPFGNLFAGGPHGVRRFLSDSNVDWGEAQGRVFDRAARGDLGRSGVLSIFYDEDGARRAGVPQVGDRLDRDEFDAIFVSVFLEDLAPAIARNTERYEKFDELRGWFPALLREVRSAAVSAEPFGDEYTLYRIRVPKAPPTAAPPSAPTP